MVKKHFAQKLWDDYLTMLKNSGALENYYNYYSKSVEWVKNNPRYFKKDILKAYRLEILLNLDPKEYIIEEPDILLDKELARLRNLDPTKISTIAMWIGGHLWEMATIISQKDCPNCIDDALRYLVCYTGTPTEKELFLECETCAWSEDLNGTKCDSLCDRVVPASKKDLLAFGIML